jgi:hypothetical protein
MKLLLLRDWLGPVIGDAGLCTHRAGEIVSVKHWPGAQLLRRYGAKWVSAEEGDPPWPPHGRPPEAFCATEQQIRQASPVMDTMIRRSMNK